MIVRLIREFANSKHIEIEKLRNVSDVLREHLMCVYYWRNTDYNAILLSSIQKY